MIAFWKYPTSLLVFVGCGVSHGKPNFCSAALRASLKIFIEDNCCLSCLRCHKVNMALKAYKSIGKLVDYGIVGQPLKREVAKETLKEIRKKLNNHVKNSYLKSVQAPIGVKATIKAWMELT